MSKHTFGPHLSLRSSFQRIMSRTPMVKPNRKDVTGQEFAPPVGQRGSATNPLGPRSRRAKHWRPVSA